MSDPTNEFFASLAERGHEPLLAKVSGRVSFEIVDSDDVHRWLVGVDTGDLAVTADADDQSVVDCTVRSDKPLFDRLCTGQENAMAAVLRGALVCSGDVELLLAIQRLFPGAEESLRPSNRTTAP
jgi:predicted lipid carrier protein YhbT